MPRLKVDELPVDRGRDRNKAAGLELPIPTTLTSDGGDWTRHFVPQVDRLLGRRLQFAFEEGYTQMTTFDLTPGLVYVAGPANGYVVT